MSANRFALWQIKCDVLVSGNAKVLRDREGVMYRIPGKPEWKKRVSQRVL